MPGSQGLPDIQFLPDGSLVNVQLKIMNLRKSSGNQHVWEQVSNIVYLKSDAFKKDENTYLKLSYKFVMCVGNL